MGRGQSGSLRSNGRITGTPGYVDDTEMPGATGNVLDQVRRAERLRRGANPTSARVDVAGAPGVQVGTVQRVAQNGQPSFDVYQGGRKVGNVEIFRNSANKTEWRANISGSKLPGGGFVTATSRAAAVREAVKQRQLNQASRGLPRGVQYQTTGNDAGRIIRGGDTIGTVARAKDYTGRTVDGYQARATSGTIATGNTPQAAIKNLIKATSPRATPKLRGSGLLKGDLGTVRQNVRSTIENGGRVTTGLKRGGDAGGNTWYTKGSTRVETKIVRRSRGGNQYSASIEQNGQRIHSVTGSRAEVDRILQRSFGIANPQYGFND